MKNEFSVESSSASSVVAKRLSAEEFLIDLFGGLVPGTLFLVIFSCLFISSIHAIMVLTSSKFYVTLGNFVQQIIQITQDIPTPIWIASFCIGGLFAFVIGHLFYRYDPEKADKESFKRLCKVYDKNHQKIKQEVEEILKNWKCRKVERVF